jgi:hypothetical protein
MKLYPMGLRPHEIPGFLSIGIRPIPGVFTVKSHQPFMNIFRCNLLKFGYIWDAQVGNAALSLLLQESS